MPKYTQLILFDCEDGRASLFDDRSILYQLPSTCDCCLFWNKSNQTVTDKLNQLHYIPQMYLCPSNLSDSNNSVVNKLIYFVGKYACYYDFIVIVHGDDNIYNEVIENVIEDYGRQRIDQKKIRQPNVQALQNLCEEVRNTNRQYNYVKPNSRKVLSQNLSMSKSVNKRKINCLECSRKFKDVLSLSEHVKVKHKPNAIFTCACSFKCSTSSDFTRHQREKRDIFDNQGIVSCLNTNEPPDIYVTPDSVPLILLTGKMNACIFECSRLWFEPAGLFRHFKAAHSNQIDIRVQCCDEKIKYTLDEFRTHIESQHNLIETQ